MKRAKQQREQIACLRNEFRENLKRQPKKENHNSLRALKGIVARAEHDGKFHLVRGA